SGWAWKSRRQAVISVCRSAMRSMVGMCWSAPGARRDSAAGSLAVLRGCVSGCNRDCGLWNDGGQRVFAPIGTDVAGAPILWTVRAARRYAARRGARPGPRGGRAHHPQGAKMNIKTALFTLAIAMLPTTGPADAATFRFGFQGDLKSLDPYSLNETFTLGVLGNVYEGLTKRGPKLEIIPGLAERWEVLEPTRWRFHLRKGVKFHNGEDFTAD